MPTNTVRDAILDGLTSELKQDCLAYFAAREAERRACENARAANRERSAAYRAVWTLQDKIEKRHPKKLKGGSIFYNIRNGRYFEAVDTKKMKDAAADGVWHLSAKTARRVSDRYTYTYGPMVPLPASHPFVKKRANARLAERLEGKDV